MKHSPILFPLILLLLAGCDTDTNKLKETSIKDHPSAFINDKAVWNGNLDKCFNDNIDSNCLINEIKKNGTSEALKSVQYLAENDETGYVAKFTKEGPIGIAVIEYPFRANTNSGILLIPSIGEPIDIEDFQDRIKTDSTWLVFEKQHPDSAPWSPATLEKKEQRDNGINLIFSYSIKNCHACDDIGSLYVSYNFTNDGKYLNYNVVNAK
ncbi:hypothetical protein VRB95_06765 [Erwinia aphidicola]|uniref:hypothetical protein n=1 Tax=Erwinia aphidicola TaxID=68334 RepID=UPI0030D33531